MNQTKLMEALMFKTVNEQLPEYIYLKGSRILIPSIDTISLCDSELNVFILRPNSEAL